MSGTRLVAALALITLALAACSAGSASELPAVSTEQPAAVATAPQPSTSVPDGLESTPEQFASPRATATVDPDAKVIYLTFDDGPWVTYTQQILDILEENQVTATFFVVGDMARRHMGLIRKEYEAGHTIGNHTWSHANLTEVSDDEIRQQIRSTGKLIGDMASSSGT